MKGICAIVLCLFALTAVTPVFAQTVDLRGKKGVVDPRDLKKYDPPKPKPKHSAPPSPTQNSSSQKPKYGGSYGVAK